jgi:hypothetical protein
MARLVPLSGFEAWERYRGCKLEQRPSPFAFAPRTARVTLLREAMQQLHQARDANACARIRLSAGSARAARDLLAICHAVMSQCAVSSRANGDDGEAVPPSVVLGRRPRRQARALG